jgi:hypothetical protein
MFDDSFYRIDYGEIFTKSLCMKHERTIFESFVSMLSQLGFERTENFRIWKRNNQKVVVCFADDFGICRQDWQAPPARWFDADTAIITDNHVNYNTQYQVYQLPSSYFGIFNYTPENQTWTPTNRFNFSVNRLDSQRLLILLELLSQSNNDISNDLVNFNCWAAGKPNDSIDNVKNNFIEVWKQLNSISSSYEHLIPNLLDTIPIKNHSKSVEQAHVSAWVNVVIETYAGDHTMAFSEKVFRALVTPAPWTLYSAKGAINYLKSLGFDVLDDIVDHSYNLVSQDSSLYGVKKVQKFISSSADLYRQLKTVDINALSKRCQQAANTNQQLLNTLQQRWPVDFANSLGKIMLELTPAK